MVLLLFIIFELIAQGFLVFHLYKLKNKLDKFRNFCFKENNLNIGKKHYFNNNIGIYWRYSKARIEEIINSDSFDLISNSA